MFRIAARNSNGGYDVVNGGVSTISTPLVTGFNETTIRFRVLAKAYNNQYTDWNDSYYDDAAIMSVTDNGNTYQYVAVESSTQFELAFSGAGSNMTLVSRS